MMTVSVIIPVYNVSAYIEHCIRSVMDQTCQDFECILVDDASTDDSINKCERMIAAYKGSIRFRILHHQQNRGLSAARNTGTEVAKGDYVLYLDSDDVISRDCLEKLKTPIIKDESIEMVMGNVEWVYEGVVAPSIQSLMHKCADLNNNEKIRYFFFNKKCIEKVAWNKLVKKDFLTRYGLTFKEGALWEDTLWTFNVLKHLNHLFMIEDITYQYTKRPNSITTGTDVQTDRFYRGLVFFEISKNFTPGDSNREAKYYVRPFCYYYSLGANTELYQKTARNFMRELTFKHDFFDYSILLSAFCLSKSTIGRKGFRILHEGYKSIKRLVHRDRKINRLNRTKGEV